MNQIHIQFHRSNNTDFIMGCFENQLCLMDFRYRNMRVTVDRRLKQGLKAEFVEQDNALLQATRQQVDEYLAADRRQFDLPLLMVGSDFQKSVWAALRQLPYGSTCSYSELASQIGRDSAVRAVATANAANALMMIIPCHRVIAANGGLGGYAGGLPLKKRLLALEQVGQGAETAIAQVG